MHAEPLRNSQFFNDRKIEPLHRFFTTLNPMRTLYLVPTSSDAKSAYESVKELYLAKPLVERDAGFDLISDELTVTGFGVRIPQQTSAALYDSAVGGFRAFFLLPRSSLSKTTLRLSNSVGLIDAGYRGTLLAAVDNHGTAPTAVAKNTRLFQISAPDLLPFEDIQIVNEIPGGATLRGSGGFGSTGVTVDNEVASRTYFGV